MEGGRGDMRKGLGTRKIVHRRGDEKTANTGGRRRMDRTRWASDGRASRAVWSTRGGGRRRGVRQQWHQSTTRLCRPVDERKKQSQSKENDQLGYRRGESEEEVESAWEVKSEGGRPRYLYSRTTRQSRQSKMGRTQKVRKMIRTYRENPAMPWFIWVRQMW